VDNSVPIQGTGVLLNSSTQPQAIQSKSLANPPMQSITGSMDDVTKDKASPIMTADLINERDTFLELAAQKGNKIQCDTFQTLYVVQLCNDYLKDIDHYAKQNIVSLDEGISLSPEDKKRLNASFEKGDISAC
jgi:hypothetical protein